MKAQQKSLEQIIEGLKESKILEQLLLENADEALFFYTIEGKLIYVNSAFQKITGYTTEELFEKNTIPFVHPDDQEWTMKQCQSLFKGKVFDDVESRIVRKDGEIRWVSSTWKIVHDNDGRPIGIKGKQRDITDRKETEQQFKESEQFNRMLLEEVQLKQVEETLREEQNKSQRYLDTVEAIIVALDTSGNITQVNRKGCELLGYEQGKLVGENWFDNFIPPEDKENDMQVFQDLIAGNIQRVEYHENAITIRNGEQRIIAWHNKILRDDDNNIIGTLAAGEDVTVRKRVEEKAFELLNQNRELTQRLFYIQEQERRHLARELHDEYGQWLTALRMHAHLLDERCTDNELDVHDSIVVIENISSQMHKSIHRMIQELRPVDLDELGLKDSLQELVDRWQENYPRTHCDLNTKGNFDDVNRMLGVTIYRIVQESLTNTAKYAEADNVSIQLDRYTGQTEGSDYLLLRIKDDGKGINPDESTEGFGIVGMRERVLAARGEFVLNYTPGEGVLIEASLPLSVKDRRKYYRCLKI